MTSRTPMGSRNEGGKALNSAKNFKQPTDKTASEMSEGQFSDESDAIPPVGLVKNLMEQEPKGLDRGSGSTSECLLVATLCSRARPSATTVCNHRGRRHSNFFLRSTEDGRHHPSSSGIGTLASGP